MLRHLRDYLGGQEPAVLVVYAIIAFVCSLGPLIMLLIAVGVVGFDFAPVD